MSYPMVDLTADDEDDDDGGDDSHRLNGRLDKHRGNDDDDADADEDDDNDDDVVEVIEPWSSTAKRKRNEPAAATPMDESATAMTNKRNRTVPPPTNHRSTGALTTDRRAFLQLQAAIGTVRVRVADSYAVGEREAVQRRVRLLLVELPPPPAGAAAHWYAFLADAQVATVCAAECVVVVLFNVQARCVALEPRTGASRLIDTTRIGSAAAFARAVGDACRAVALPSVAGVKRSHSATAAAAAVVVDDDATTRALMSAQEEAYAAALAADVAREQQRTRLTQRRMEAVVRNAERSARAVAAAHECHVRVRLPNGSVVESVFDSSADTVQALLDFVIVEASRQLAAGDAFDVANYELVAQFPKRCVGDAAQPLRDALQGGRRVMLLLEEKPI